MGRARKPLAATFILHKTRKDRLESVTELNAWGQDLDDVSILSQTPHIRLVALACNCLNSLGYVQPVQCINGLIRQTSYQRRRNSSSQSLFEGF